MRYFVILFLIAFAGTVSAQSVSAKSSELIVDFSDPRSDHSVSMSTITWISPYDTLAHVKGDNLVVAADVKSMYGLLSAKIFIKDPASHKALKDFKVPITEDNKNNLRIFQKIPLPNGKYEIEILIENLEGFFVRTTRQAIVEESKVK